MHLIKLSAISSTNDFLKQLAATQYLENFTVVWADNQTNGKGQMGSKWIVESSKNLTFSVLLKDESLKTENLFTLNIIVANAVLKALFSFELANIHIKWPNDILSYSKKIAGILIENNIKADGTIQAIVGIGINISQTDFEGFKQASSLLNQYQIEIDKEVMLNKIILFLKESFNNFEKKADEEWEFYHQNLFRKDVVSTFENINNEKFLGIIKRVNHHGQLVVQLENDDLKFFNLKEIKLMY